MRPGPHGFHVHEQGRITNCDSTGVHFNPTGHNHGFFNEANRHAGALGNIVARNDGLARFDRMHSLLNITGDPSEFNIMGRAVVLHLNRDDLGRGPENS